MIFFSGSRGPPLVTFLRISSNAIMAQVFRIKMSTSDAVSECTADKIPQVANGIELQVVRTIAPKTYPATPDGDQDIRELYFNMLGAAGEGNLVYIENQYFFDHGIISEIHEAAERGAKIIAILTSKPDEGTTLGEVESDP